MLSWVEHEKRFIISRPDQTLQVTASYLAIQFAIHVKLDAKRKWVN